MSKELSSSHKKAPKAITPQIGSIQVPLATYDRQSTSYPNYYTSRYRYSLYNKISIPQIEKIYETVSIIRAIHDGIEQTISSLDWSITSRDADKPAPESHIENTRKFFENPNRNNESFQQIISYWVKDLLKFDVAVGEKILNKLGEFIGELYSRYSPEFYPHQNNHGILLGYEQRFNRQGMKSVWFNPDELIYMSMYATNENPNGMPKMNSIYSEIASFIYANDYIKSTFDKNQIPPCILAYENSAGEKGSTQISRGENERLRRAENRTQDLELTTLENVGKVQLIDLSGADKRAGTIDLLISTSKQIFAAYGVSAVGFSQTQDSNRATSIVQQGIEKSKIIRPIISLIERYVNQEIVHKHMYDDVSWKLGDLEDLDPKTNLDIVTQLESQNIITKNEARKSFGYKPYTPEELEKAEGHREEKDDIDNAEDEENTDEEKQSSGELRDEEGTKKKRLELLNLFKIDYADMEKNVLINLPRAYYGNGKTNNAISSASHSLFGKFKSSVRKSGISNGDQNVLKSFTDSIENNLRKKVRDIRSSHRTKRWQEDDAERDRFKDQIKKFIRGKYYDNLVHLANVVIGSK